MKILIGVNPMGLEKSIPALQAQYPSFEIAYCPDRGETLTQMIADTDIYMGWLDRNAFLAARQLKWIQSPSSGVNMFLDIPELAAGNATDLKEVLLTSASGTHAAAVAESAMAMILAETRGIRPAILDQASKAWNAPTIRAKMVELTGSTMLIVGLGAIGRALAQRAKGFDMRVIAVDLNPAATSPHVDAVYPLHQMGDVMGQADYVVVLVPFTPQTENMFGAAEIAKMKSNALLVGMSRGGIINQDALVAALKAGTLAGALLDVFKPEPLPAESELWTLPNVLVAPHIAGGTQYEGKYIMDIFNENLTRFLAGQRPLRNEVDKVAGF